VDVLYRAAQLQKPVPDNVLFKEGFAGFFWMKGNAVTDGHE